MVLSSPLSTSLIAATEAAYDIEQPSHDRWLANILESARPALDRGLGMSSWLFDFRDLQDLPAVVTVGNPPDTSERLQRLMRQASGDLVRMLYSQGRYVVTASMAIGPEAAREFYRSPDIAMLGMQDCLSVLCTDADGVGVGIGVALPDTLEVTEREARRLECLAAHITSAYRLRRLFGAVEAVVLPGGRVAHAEGVARDKTARELLRTAAVTFDRVRMRSIEADEALDLWRVLVAGRWTLVDSFDRDGKRYLLARQNTPHPAFVGELSMRESQVAAFASLGHSVKMIAYALGLSESSVNTYLGRALAKLGFPGRLELARRFAAFFADPSTRSSPS